MDANKLEQLRDTEFYIPLTCGLCAHGQFPRFGRWGGCSLHRYWHEKHDNPDDGRETSVPWAGTCPDATPRDDLEEQLGAFMEFVLIPDPSS